MAITQMVGARYVTKFYTNSEDGTPKWQTGVSYEALICVSFNYSAYVSKIPVPASVGNPAENPTYWAEFPNPSMGLWEELKIRLENEIENRENGDDDLLAKLNQEIADRQAGDTSLQNTINSVSTDLSQEIADRKAGDTALESSINTVASDLSAEITNRENADNNLKTVIMTALKNIIAKFYAGGTLNESTGAITWGDSGKAVVGNLNVYGNDAMTSYIKSHAEPAENDVKVN